jgi:hypothetical protein
MYPVQVKQQEEHDFLLGVLKMTVPVGIAIDSWNMGQLSCGKLEYGRTVSDSNMVTLTRGENQVPNELMVQLDCFCSHWQL